ncbi:hypothetical protein [Actinokineospora sp. NPDC004072]
MAEDPPPRAVVWIASGAATALVVLVVHALTGSAALALLLALAVPIGFGLKVDDVLEFIAQRRSRALLRSGEQVNFSREQTANGHDS